MNGCPTTHIIEHLPEKMNEETFLLPTHFKYLNAINTSCLISTHIFYPLSGQNSTLQKQLHQLLITTNI